MRVCVCVREGVFVIMLAKLKEMLERSLYYLNVSRKSKVVLPIQHHRFTHSYDNCIQKGKCLILFKVTVITCLGKCYK